MAPIPSLNLSNLPAATDTFNSSPNSSPIYNYENNDYYSDSYHFFPQNLDSESSEIGQEIIDSKLAGSRLIPDIPREPRALTNDKFSVIKEQFQKRHPEKRKSGFVATRAKKSEYRRSRRNLEFLDYDSMTNQEIAAHNKKFLSEFDFVQRRNYHFNSKNGFMVKTDSDGNLRGSKLFGSVFNIIFLTSNIVSLQVKADPYGYDPLENLQFSSRRNKKYQNNLATPKYYLSMDKHGQVKTRKYLNEESLFYFNIEKNHYYSYASIRHHKNFKDLYLGMDNAGRLRGYLGHQRHLKNTSFLPTKL